MRYKDYNVLYENSNFYGGGVTRVNQCPFLSSIEEKVTCFIECAFYEHEGMEEECPFKKVKAYKNFNFKEILQLDIDNTEEEDLFEDSFIKEYL